MSKARSSAYLIGANLLAAVIQFLAVPWYLHWFGDGYSAYLYVIAIWGYVDLVCPTFSGPAQKRITEAIAAGRQDLARLAHEAQLFGTAASSFLCFGVALAMGMWFKLPGGGSAYVPLLEMFVVAAVGFAFRGMNGSTTAVLSAHERFGMLALRQAAESLVAAVASVALAFATRSPVYLFAGAAAGSAAGLVIGQIMVRRIDDGFALRPRPHWAGLRDLFGLNLKALPHTAVNQMASGLDRILLPLAGGSISVVAQYAVPYRLPETLSTLLAPAIDTTVPELTRQSATDRQAFANAIDRYGLQALLVAATLILVPSGWGGPFLKLWLGSAAPPGGAAVVLLIGLYFSLNFYFSTLTRAYRATGEMQYAAPFSGLNALATLLLTIPMARWAGVVGVAAMNAAINLVQIVPFAWVLRKTTAPAFPVRRHLYRAMAVLLVGAAFAGCGYALGGLPVFARHPWLCLIAGPLMVAASGAALLGLRLVPLPTNIRWHRDPKETS